MYISEKKTTIHLDVSAPEAPKNKSVCWILVFFYKPFLVFFFGGLGGKKSSNPPNLRVCPVIFCVACSSAKKRSPTYKASTKILKSETFAEPGGSCGGAGGWRVGRFPNVCQRQRVRGSGPWKMLRAGCFVFWRSCCLKKIIKGCFAFFLGVRFWWLDWR